MNFVAPNWESNEIGDQMHTKLFQTIDKKRKKLLRKNKKCLPKKLKQKQSDIILESSNLIVKKAKKIRQQKIQLATKNVDKTFTKHIQTNVKKSKPKPQLRNLQSQQFKIKNQNEPTNELKKNKNIDCNVPALKSLFDRSNNNVNAKNNPKSLRERMQEQLQSSRFRYINEQMYTSNGSDALKLFKSDPGSFKAYHEGFRQQVAKWPMNPIDTIIKSIKTLPKNYIIADFGCGDAKLAKSVPQKVHSFDLMAENDLVTACNMSHCPLASGTVDVAVYCLSLMGTNLNDYLLEANRVLKVGGILKIAEVESRFEGVDVFINGLKNYGFEKTWQDLSYNLFYFLDFKKERNIKQKNKLPTISLHPCLYKKR